MTTELEKSFFHAFGIQPRYYCDDEYISEAMLEHECTNGDPEKCKTCKHVGIAYPQITDSILLHLICNAISASWDRNNVKNTVLQILINQSVINSRPEQVQYIQSLFEEQK